MGLGSQGISFEGDHMGLSSFLLLLLSAISPKGEQREMLMLSSQGTSSDSDIVGLRRQGTNFEGDFMGLSSLRLISRV